MSAWVDHVNKWKDCQACPLCNQRDQIVLGRGQVPCDVLMIGEAPGEVEDTTGLPFKGPAGALLDRIVERALSDLDVVAAYCNLVCCFPRDKKLMGLTNYSSNHEPDRAEILACRLRLVEFVNIAQPRLIVCVGALATDYIDQQDTIKCINIVHPAHILAHMPKVQQDYAINKCIVQIRTAVDKMLETPLQPFTKWGTDAYLSQGRGLKQRYDAWTKDHADLEVGF